MVKLQDDERRMLLTVLDMHLEGMADAKEQMIEDSGTLSTFESFTDTLQQHDIDTAIVESIKKKVLDDD